MFLMNTGPNSRSVLLYESHTRLITGAQAKWEGALLTSIEHDK